MECVLECKDIFEALKNQCWNVCIPKIIKNDPLSVNAIDLLSGNTPLHIVSYESDVTHVQHLIDKGANTFLIRNLIYQNTPLMTACSRGYIDVICLLYNSCPSSFFVKDTYGDVLHFIYYLFLVILIALIFLLIKE